jgi:hypothetical protein
LSSEGQAGNVEIEWMHRGVGSTAVGTSSDKEIPVIEARSKEARKAKAVDGIICCV